MGWCAQTQLSLTRPVFGTPRETAETRAEWLRPSFGTPRGRCTYQFSDPAKVRRGHTKRGAERPYDKKLRDLRVIIETRYGEHRGFSRNNILTLRHPWHSDSVRRAERECSYRTLHGDSETRVLRPFHLPVRGAPTAHWRRIRPLLQLGTPPSRYRRNPSTRTPSCTRSRSAIRVELFGREAGSWWLASRLSLGGVGSPKGPCSGTGASVSKRSDATGLCLLDARATAAAIGGRNERQIPTNLQPSPDSRDIRCHPRPRMEFSGRTRVKSGHLGGHRWGVGLTLKNQPGSGLCHTIYGMP